MKIVTEFIEGLKVVRGRDWEWGDQDKGSIYGIIQRDLSSRGWVVVSWFDKNGKNLTGNNYSYRIGGYGVDAYDLFYYEDNGDAIIINSSKSKKRTIVTDIPQFFSKPV